MESYSLGPLLTERDPAESAEGGIDPLGTEPLADTLAVRLVPGVRERMHHPRFATAMAVSLEVCRDFEDGTLAADGISEPWQVFEWYLVEGLVRSVPSDDRLGLPGSQKATKAIADRVPLSAKRYLKTPTVFGFHGIYRQLARNLGIEEAGHLGETGFQLLSVWAKEQGLEGFCGSGGGPGLTVRQQLVDAIQAGLEKGATARSSTWSGWGFFGKHLAPYAAGRREAQFLASALLNDSKGYRREVLEFLTTDGLQIWEAHGSERQFYQVLRTTNRDGLSMLLDAIGAYEEFSRLCHDAFQDCLCELTRQGGKKTSPTVLAELPSVKQAAERLPASFDETIKRLEPLGEVPRFRDAFTTLAERGTDAEWAERLIEHHRTTQRRKPPNGKNPWVERFDDGSFMIRPDYRTDKPGTHDDSYAHLYRIRSLWQFASDLRVIKS